LRGGDQLGFHIRQSHAFDLPFDHLLVDSDVEPRVRPNDLEFRRATDAPLDRVEKRRLEPPSLP